MTAVNKIDKTVKIRRTKDNSRQRSNSHRRHDPFVDEISDESRLQFLNPSDLEWMSVNYRKQRAAKLSSSPRRIILVMLQKDFNYFPSLRELRDELISAQLNEIKIKSLEWTDQSRFAFMKKNYIKKWTFLFDIANLGNLDQNLTPTILSDPSHKITKHILYLYSMESFIYGELNKASRCKEKSKIQFYGAFAAALSYIIYEANKNRKG